MIVKSEDFDRFITRPPAQVFLYLFHGTDLGLIHERARLTARHGAQGSTDAFQLVRLSGDQIAANPGLLADEAGTMGLFGDKRFIWIESGSKSFVDAIEYQLDHPPENCVIVIEAGSLKPASPLRKLVESSPHAASIPCYADGPEQIKRLIETTLLANRLSIEPETRDALAGMLGNDRLITRSELDKLVLYAYGHSTVSFEDISAILVDASDVALDEAVDAAFGGKRSEVERQCQRFFRNGGDAAHLLNSALSHALKLHRMRLELDSGAQIDTLLSRSGLFYSRKRIVQAYLGRWQAESLKNAINTLQETVARTRQQNNLAQLLNVRAFWKVAGMVSGR